MVHVAGSNCRRIHNLVRRRYKRMEPPNRRLSCPLVFNAVLYMSSAAGFAFVTFWYGVTALANSSPFHSATVITWLLKPPFTGSWLGWARVIWILVRPPSPRLIAQRQLYRRHSKPRHKFRTPRRTTFPHLSLQALRLMYPLAWITASQRLIRGSTITMPTVASPVDLPRGAPKIQRKRVIRRGSADYCFQVWLHLLGYATAPSSCSSEGPPPRHQ